MDEIRTITMDDADPIITTQGLIKEIEKSKGIGKFLWTGIALIVPFIVIICSVSINLIKITNIQSILISLLIIAAYSVGIILIYEGLRRRKNE